MLPQANFIFDSAWQEAYGDRVRAIVGPHVLEPSSFEVDTKRAADFVVKNVTVACRLRRPGYERYHGQFTIRSVRANGVKTELAKIEEGWGDWLFYGHVDHDDLIQPWYLLDLHIFRATLRSARFFLPDCMIGEERENRDGGATAFRAYQIKRFPSELVIASSPQRPAREPQEATA